MLETSLWDSGIYTGGMSCRVCHRTRNVKQGKDNDWALCGVCHDQGYVVTRKENSEIEYRGPAGTFSSPYSK